MSVQAEQYLLTNVTADVTGAANLAAGVVGHAVDGPYVIKVWSETADWGGGTVTLYMMADDDTLIALTTFTANGIYEGVAGSHIERFVAGVSSSTTPDLSATVTH